MKQRSAILVVLLVTTSVLTLTGCTSNDDRDYMMCMVFGGVWEEQVYWPVGSEHAQVRIGCTYGGAKSAAASPGDALFINAAAHVAGAQGTNWRSDLEVHNLSEESAVFTLILLEHGMDNSLPDDIELSLAQGKSTRLGDVLESEFGTGGIAALILVPSSGRIIVTSRTYNLLGEGNALGLPAGSTFGQYIPGLSLEKAIRFGEQGRLIQLSHSSSIDGGARANLGLVNASGGELRVKVELFTSEGELLGIVTRNLAPYEYEQLNRVYERVTSGDVADGYAVLRTTTPGGTFFAYASVVDNLTGDPVAISAARLPADAPSGPGDPAYVVAAAHVAGAAGTNWRTDLEVHCWSDEAADYIVELLEHGANNSNPRRESFSLASGESVRFEDILDTVFAFEGAAALRITPTRGRILVSSRTYNLLGKGNEFGLPEGATFGQYIPGESLQEAVAFGEEGRLIQLSHSTDDTSGSRANLVLVNAAANRIDVTIGLYNADGTFLGTIERSLKPYEYRQLNRVFAGVTSSDIDDGYAVVRTTTESGAFFALASVVDNATGDPVGMGAPVILKVGGDGVVRGVEGIYQGLGHLGIESLVGRVQTLEVGGVVDMLVDGLPELASRNGDDLVIDYGGGWTTGDGRIHEGSINIDTSGLSVNSSGISGAMTITYDGYLVDGEAPAIGPTRWTFGLNERADGSVFGDVTVGPVGGLKSIGSMSGTIGIDTDICLEYPISGSLTTVVDNQVVTITFGPDCDGGFDLGNSPSNFFSYNYGDPAGPNAQEYVVSSSNAVVAGEGSVNYWRPMVGGEEFGETTPGVITFHFPFGNPIVSGRLLMTLATFHFSYSRGHNFIYGSTDGVDWQLLAELEPPDFGAGRGGGLNGDLPAMFIGESDIWLQARLYSYGPSAAAGGIYCNTAEMSRWDSNGTGNTFELEVELE